IEDAVLPEAGLYACSFILEDQVIAAIEVPVFLQQVPTSLPKHVEDGLKRSDVIWVGVPNGARPSRGRFRKRPGRPVPLTMVPAWFAYKGGKIFLLSQRERGSEEQTIPGLDIAHEITVVTRRKGRDTALDEFPATVRILSEGDDYEAALATLADRRRSRVG